MIELGKWYKYVNFPAYGQIIRIYKLSLVIRFDNGYQQTFTKKEFAELFISTPTSERMKRS